MLRVESIRNLVRAAALLALVMSPGCAKEPTPGTRVTTSDASMGVVQVRVSDTCTTSAPRVTAFGLWVDGTYTQDVLVFPNSGERTYTALIGPLAAGPHTVDLRPSSWWAPVPCVVRGDVNVATVAPTDATYLVYSRSPVLELRADTVGEQTDVPLYAYAERLPGDAGALTLRYSVVFSNEDGGTPTRALLSRWGRSTDIEEVYDVTLTHGRAAKEEFQGPDHAVRVFAGRRRGVAPVLLVATLNNMVIDRGRGVVAVRPVPDEFDLTSATRESTMDARPWVYRLMEAERVAEGRMAADAPLDDQWVKRAPDARDHVYLEAKITVDKAVAAAWVEDRTGRRYWSHYGRVPLAIDRSAWVRTAVAVGPNPGASIVSAGWACVAEPETKSGGRCEIDATRAFTLTEDYRPVDLRVGPARFTLAAGADARMPAGVPAR
jgi:hypothetical protein